MIDNLLLLFQAPTIAVQTLIDGILIGAILALAAYGMALVWGVMNIINIVQGELVILGGYITLTLADMTGLHPLWMVPASAVIMYFIGYGIYKTVIHRVVDEDMFISILATFGISIILQQLMDQVFGADIQSADTGFDTWGFLDDRITLSQIHVISLAIVMVFAVCLVLYLKRSKMGRAIRATSQDARAARIMGVDTDHVYATTYALNAAICGAAGSLVVMIWIIHPFLGLAYTVRSFLIVIVAGLGNMVGVVVAGFGLGAAEQFAAFLLGIEFRVAFVFLLMVVILVWRNFRLSKERKYLK